MNWVLQTDNSIKKFCAKISKSDARRIIETIESLEDNPFFGDIQKMKDEENSWRRRVGNYRIFYEIIPKENLIYVYEVRRRTSNTY
ncbi:type II toxin-antitoxin system RelE/ParE family toxin [Candidatus Nomurabacteria bacterium]|nr:type II toxin-antitoxin system RelE/ParE family toxin [Candidatus Nomurabacteria bacterium]